MTLQFGSCLLLLKNNKIHKAIVLSSRTVIWKVLTINGLKESNDKWEISSGKQAPVVIELVREGGSTFKHIQGNLNTYEGPYGRRELLT